MYDKLDLLFNLKSGEMHDLKYATGQCNVGKMRHWIVVPLRSMCAGLLANVFVRQRPSVAREVLRELLIERCVAGFLSELERITGLRMNRCGHCARAANLHMLVLLTQLGRRYRY